MCSILIVDDHPDIRRLLSVILGKNHQIIEAENGAMALEAVKEHQPDIVLLDVMMPGDIDGLQVLQAIKSNLRTHSTLVAMISARGQDSDSAEARTLGANAYFIKPFSPLQVAAWVKNNLPTP